MKTMGKRILGFYTQPTQATQPRGRIVIAVQGDEQREAAAALMREIAEGIGVEQTKTAQIKAKRGIMQQQQKGMEHINSLLNDIKKADEKEMAFAYAGIATGYANAMRTFDLIEDTELRDVIAVIEQAGQRAIDRIEKEKRPILWRAIHKRAKA